MYISLDVLCMHCGDMEWLVDDVVCNGLNNLLVFVCVCVLGTWPFPKMVCLKGEMTCCVPAVGAPETSHWGDTVLLHRLSPALQDTQHLQTPPEDTPRQAPDSAWHLYTALRGVHEDSYTTLRTDSRP